MARPSISWLITDTHWFHDNIIQLCGRPANYNESLITNMRHVIAAQDTLYHLGDVILYRHPELKGILDSIPGTKVLLQGNHDRKSRGWYRSNGFAYVADAILLGDILLSHKPMPNLPNWVRVNVHGHWHDNAHRERPDWYDPARYLLLSVEKTNYRPVKLDEFVRSSSDSTISP